jgi:hypothetical protein
MLQLGRTARPSAAQLQSLDIMNFMNVINVIGFDGPPESELSIIWRLRARDAIFNSDCALGGRIACRIRQD